MYTQNLNSRPSAQALIDSARTAAADYQKGFAERLAGYYDKWYRRRRRDEGKAYDQGVMAAARDPRCKPDCVIIEFDC